MEQHSKDYIQTLIGEWNTHRYAQEEIYATIGRIVGGALNRGEVSMPEMMKEFGIPSKLLLKMMKLEEEWRAQIAKDLEEMEGCGCP